MKKIIIFISLTAALGWAALVSGQDKDESGNEREVQKSESKESAEKKIVGFKDANKDGVNDLFYDANGDGINDVDGKPYSHRFKFKDENKDKINDLWIDRDGDGVNDLNHKMSKADADDLHKQVLDVDEDRHNDITGERIDRAKGRGQGDKFGFWNESKGKPQGRFIDEDGDGIDDRVRDFEGFMRGQHQGRGKQDRFIDEDGDGICDDRSDFINRMGGRGHHGRGDSRKGGSRH